MPALRRSSPSPFLNLPLLILLLSIFAFLLFVLAIFPASSHSKLRPTIAVKKSWDCLSVFLVLFAILYGIFARKNDDDLPPAGDDTTANNRNVSKEDETHSASSNWFDQFSRSDTPASDGLRRLKRSSSSYPDLRQDSMWDSNDDRYRFFDDFEIRKYQSPSASSEYVYHRRQRSVLQESNVKEIPVYTSALPSSPPSPVKPPPSPAPPPPPPSLPPPATSHRRQNRTYRTVARKEKVENTGENDHKFTEMKNRPSTPPPPPPQPPPPPPMTKWTRSEHCHWKSERKKINATKELKMVLISLYHQSKGKKKQKTKSLYDDLLHSRHEPQSFTVPPPPPPLPPPSVFQSLFRKGSKNKRVYSYSAPPPPPPPPPPPRPLLSSSKRWSKRKNYAPPSAPPPAPPAPPTPPRVHSRGRNSTATGRPPLPTRVNNMHGENVNSGGQSPLIPMPPPPLPPPFRVPGFKFRVQGEYVKIRSAHSSRCSSPEPDKLDKRSTKTVNVMDSGDGIGGPVFCPSPDVNAKADTFIARLRGEWRLEKIKSIKEKRSMGLAMELSPGPSTV